VSRAASRERGLEPSFRSYQARDRATLLGLFDANCPAFFAPNERADYEIFLDTTSADYEVCLLADLVVGAYGLRPEPDNGLALRWILLAPQYQGHGLGSAMMARVLTRARDNGADYLYIGASHKSAPFFARFGARETATIPNGWGPGMHRVDMTLKP